MRVDRRCDAFLRRLDRMDSNNVDSNNVDEDPHLQDCPSCMVEMRLARRTREILADGRGSAGAGAPLSFAARVAYIAAADRGEEVEEGRLERILSSPALAFTAVLTALALAFQATIPSFLERLHLAFATHPLGAAIRGDLLAIAIPALALVAIGALAGVTLARRSA